MALIVYVALISGLILLGLFFLYKKEFAAGERMLLIKIRYKADILLETLMYKISVYIASHNAFQRKIKVIFHYYIHKILGFIHKFLELCDARITRLQRSNKILASKDGGVRELSHLDHVKVHKDQIRNGAKGL